jgi:dTDP-4-dehydrorhamnose reductase
MKVLIIGSRGQLGTDLAKSFSDCQTTLYTSEDMDITDESLVQQQIAFTAPDLVVNSAAFTRVDECESEYTQAFLSNAIGPRNLALACKRWDIPLIHISTNYVFNGEKKDPYNEDDKTQPLNSYGISKLAGEHFIEAIWHKHMILRVSGLFGITPSRMKGTNFVEAMIRLGSKGNPLRIVCDEYISPTFTKDAAKVIRKLADLDQYGIYHLSNSGSCSWIDFAREIFRLTNIEVPLNEVTAKEYGAQARRPINSSLNTNKINNLGLGPLRDWKEALQEYIDLRNKITESQSQ